MSNVIPIVSSSPPPLDDDDDDGNFKWDDDDDDDEYGNFTCAPSVSSTSIISDSSNINWSNSKTPAFPAPDGLSRAEQEDLSLSLDVTTVGLHVAEDYKCDIGRENHLPVGSGEAIVGDDDDDDNGFQDFACFDHVDFSEDLAEQSSETAANQGETTSKQSDTQQDVSSSIAHSGSLAAHSGSPAACSGSPAAHSGSPAACSGSPAAHSGPPVSHSGFTTEPMDEVQDAAHLPEDEEFQDFAQFSGDVSVDNCANQLAECGHQVSESDSLSSPNSTGDGVHNLALDLCLETDTPRTGSAGSVPLKNSASVYSSVSTVDSGVFSADLSPSLHGGDTCDLYSGVDREESHTSSLVLNDDTPPPSDCPSAAATSCDNVVALTTTDVTCHATTSVGNSLKNEGAEMAGVLSNSLQHPCDASVSRAGDHVSSTDNRTSCDTDIHLARVANQEYLDTDNKSEEIADFVEKKDALDHSTVSTPETGEIGSSGSSDFLTSHTTSQAVAENSETADHLVGGSVVSSAGVGVGDGQLEYQAMVVHKDTHCVDHDRNIECNSEKSVQHSNVKSAQHSSEKSVQHSIVKSVQHNSEKSVQHSSEESSGSSSCGVTVLQSPEQPDNVSHDSPTDSRSLSQDIQTSHLHGGATESCQEAVHTDSSGSQVLGVLQDGDDDDKEFGDFSSYGCQGDNDSSEVAPITFRTSICENDESAGDNDDEFTFNEGRPPSCDDDGEEEDEFGEFGAADEDISNERNDDECHEVDDSPAQTAPVTSSTLSPAKDITSGVGGDDDDFGEFDQSAPTDAAAGWADFGSAPPPEAANESFGSVISKQALPQSSPDQTQAQKLDHVVRSCFLVDTEADPPVQQTGAQTGDSQSVDSGHGKGCVEEERDEDCWLPLDMVVDLGLSKALEAKQQTWTLVQHPSKKDPKVRLWAHLKDVDSSHALMYGWHNSHCSKEVYTSLHIDTQNILFSHKKQAVPFFATGLGILEPIRGVAGSADRKKEQNNSTSTLVDSGRSESRHSSTLQDIPPVDFDWSSSGLTNPLTANTLDLDFLVIQGGDSSQKTSVFKAEDRETVPSAMQPLEDILKRTTPTVKLATNEVLSREAVSVLERMPDLSFMQSRVLMFPVKQ